MNLYGGGFDARPSVVVRISLFVQACFSLLLGWIAIVTVEMVICLAAHCSRLLAFVPLCPVGALLPTGETVPA